MKPEIKRRIEQIRQGEIPEEYQKKSVGIIPKNWNKSFLGAIIKELSSGVSVNSDVTIDTGVYVLKTSSVSEGKVNLRESKPIIPEDLKRVRCPVLQGTILISRMNTPILVGECGYVNEGSDIHYLPDRLWQAINRSEKICNFKWLNYLLNSDRYRTAIHALGTGTSNSMKNISKEDFLTLPIAFPPLLEQKKIADILTTQDKVIELKEKRLTEKQRQKKYLMQQLLTGKKRLPGFSEEWKIKPLKKLTEKQKKKNNGFQYRLVLSNSAQHGIVSQDQEFNKEIANEERIDGYYVVIPGAFVYNPRISVTAPCGPINVNETGETGIMSPLYTVFTISSPQISQDFLKYYFQSSCWYKYVKGVANYGARHDRISISDDDFFDMPIPLPTKEEQNYIAKVLSAADREIELLQQDIEQEKQKEKALMQLLLTGIVRVPV